MSKVRFTLNILAVVVFTLMVTSMAQAQATRTWVSGVGDDANPCSRTAPCKTFAGAISKTATGGEIDALDPGGFGAVTITKSITIDGSATLASILASSTTGVIINLTNANDAQKTVRLRGLSINGAGPGVNGAPTGVDGIRFIAGSALHVEDTVIDGFTQQGIEINPTSGTPAEVYVRNTTIRNCTTDGILVTHASVVSVASFTNVEIGNCGNGINVGIRGRATVRNSTLHSNTTAINNSTANSEATLFHCSLSNNVTAISGGTSPSIARISDTMIYGNATGVTGNVKSWGNNYIDGNTTNGTPVLPNLTQL